MIKFILTLACVSLVSVSADAKSLPSTTSTAAQVQMPCAVPGHTNEKACVLVTRKISPAKSVFDTDMDMSVAKDLALRVKVFSVIYSYQVADKTNQTVVGAMIKRGDHAVFTDVRSDKPTIAFVTTYDGGWTWTNVDTADKDNSLTF